MRRIRKKPIPADRSQIVGVPAIIATTCPAKLDAMRERAGKSISDRP